MRRRALLLLLALAAPALAAAAAAPSGPRPAPSAEELAEARKLVAEMKADPRGPFQRLRWFCADGSVHPPQPYPCRDLGGGRQHGEHSARQARLAELGYFTGTVFAAATLDELMTSQPRQGRLRELALERYMVDVDEGWVLRRARTYRGAFQIEDEEAAGRALLLALLADRRLVREEFLLVRESARVIPHAGQSGDGTREIRRASLVLAEQDATFDPIRVRIHNVPSLADAAAARRWADGAEAADKDAALVTAARDLAIAIEALYGAEGRAARLAAASARVARGGADARFVTEALAQASSAPGARGRALALASLMRRLRERVEVAPVAEALALLDIARDVEADLIASAVEALGDPHARDAEPWAFAAALADASYGAGFLSARERDALTGPALAVAGEAASAPVADRLAAARGLERAAAWAAGTVRHAFAEPLARYAALDDRAARFLDDALRGSPLLPLADAASRLARAAEAEAGLTHRLFGASAAGIAGLNPGVAVGALRVVSEAELAAGARLDPADIVVLPATVAELSPVAGILTIAEGNALSHVQMLARNLGIPNAVLPPGVRDRVAAHAGERVLFGVSSAGVVVVEPGAALPPGVLDVVTGEARRAAAAQRVVAPVPDFTVRDLLPLEDLHGALSGRVVGPKAANLGELARLFPGRVAPAVAIPFGLWAAHAGLGNGSPRARLAEAFAAHREGTLDQAGLEQAIDGARASVEALAIDAPTREALARLCAARFGEPGTYGVFVRSDTNVEDLPQFTGAGLNKTIPHVVGFDEMLAAVPKVWASAFTQRAMAWRGRALANPEEVHPSVLLMRSVPSDKSGVLVTADVATGGSGLTVSVAHGVGGAVDGESAETIVLRPDGAVTLVAEAKAPWRRALAPGGGVAWVPAAMGRVLEDAEIAQLRAMARELEAKLTPEPGEDGRALPWDVEFGFVGGELTLFQVRPLVARGAALADRVVAALTVPPAAPAAPAVAPRPVAQPGPGLHERPSAE